MLFTQLELSPTPSLPFLPFSLLKRDLSDIKLSIALEDDLENSSGVIRSVAENTDLIPKVYEGGLKTWEGSLDLVCVLESLWRDRIGGGKVLELGCGSALPGIWCLLRGAAKVDFQDYNDQVLKLATMPNVGLNLNPPTQSGVVDPDSEPDATLEPSSFSAGDRARYFSGGWTSLPSLLEPATYDLILTSETIYNTSSQPSLLQCIKHCMKPDGTALVAAKKNYFGLSGSLFGFLELCSKSGLRGERVWEEGGGVGREIWALKWA